MTINFRFKKSIQTYTYANMPSLIRSKLITKLIHFNFLASIIIATVASPSFANTFESTQKPKPLPNFENGKDYEIHVLADKLKYPWSIASITQGKYLLSLRSGSLQIIDTRNKTSNVISNTPESLIRSQGGYFDVITDLNFKNNKTIFLAYAHGSAKANTTRVASATINMKQFKLENFTPIFSVSPTKNTSAHFGGRLIQLADNSILLTTGDGFQYREAAQDPFSQLGKVVRFMPDGSVPKDNPHADGKNANPYVYTLGHRSPQGLALDNQNRILMNEHGAKGGDEINLIEAGQNYGWPKTTHGVNYTGALISPHKELPNIFPPLLHWTPSIAPSGLAFYSANLFPKLKNCILNGGLVSKDVRCARLESNTINEEYSLFSEVESRIRDVRVSSTGTILLLTDSDEGSILEIVPVK